MISSIQPLNRVTLLDEALRGYVENNSRVQGKNDFISYKSDGLKNGDMIVDQPDNIKLVKVATLTSVEAYQEFQRNVEIMQKDREMAIKIKKSLDNETVTEKKQILENELDEKIKEINVNNKKMIESYGFSLNRNYVMVVETAHIYMQVTDEKDSKIKKTMEK